MAKNLVIVESPAKAKTIEKFLGQDFIVRSSFGHIRDLPKKGLNIDIAKEFEPHYEISSDKKKVVSALKKEAKDKTVWLASDEDREGEAIAWHLSKALGLDTEKTNRILFHEITKSAIDAAIKNPKTIDLKLVDAQQARRILDRLVGYELSPVLWRKVRTGLSAGRVQSVAVRLIVEREREIRDFEAKSSYKLTATFYTDKHDIAAELEKKLPSKQAAEDWLKAVIGANFTVDSIQQKPSTRNPSAPFTTSTLQQEASRRLGFSVSQTMTLAQRLYEAGHITYMRTDSTTLSNDALNAAESFIKHEYGDKYYHRRQYQTKNSSAQEAHEAIRPTDFNRQKGGADATQAKLYALIWQRALASQMSAAKTERTELIIKNDKQPENFIAKGEILEFDGFMKVYGGAKDDTILPPLQIGQSLEVKHLLATENFTKAPARYSEAMLVKKLEELGIGRPSTYAPTISTIQTRGYVEKSDLEGEKRQITELKLEGKEITESSAESTVGADRGKLLPTGIAEVVTDFLVNNFSSIIDYDFTAQVESEFDDIADGKQAWNKMIADFYKDFHPLVEKSENISRAEVAQAREIGKDPKSGEPIFARFGRYGPMLQMGDSEDETKKPKFAGLPKDTTIDTVTLDQALEMFKLPKTIGKTENGQDIKANIGRFGPYIQIDKTYVSIKPLDPHTITEEQARELYAEKLAKDAAKNINEFANGVKVLNGPYGPYITDGKKNARISKDIDPKSITEEQATKILADAPVKKGFRRRSKKPKK